MVAEEEEEVDLRPESCNLLCRSSRVLPSLLGNLEDLALTSVIAGVVDIGEERLVVDEGVLKAGSRATMDSHFQSYLRY